MMRRNAARLLRLVGDLSPVSTVSVAADAQQTRTAAPSRSRGHHVRATLQALGCDIAQGYHCARPMPGADVAAWLRTHAAPTAMREVAF
ncbi:hypothetical protein ACQP2P_30680 [Dactylosporangium sp. CA-139114]|uniref:hypothetical protein n=1 Tax=Dactylosporangium sp. CA-139114 TaxID=3239931 RepID=UPI003D99F945